MNKLTAHLTIIVKDNLNKGLIANICSVISTSFSRFGSDIIGPDIETNDYFYPGITKIPIIVLGYTNGNLTGILDQAISHNITYILYDKIALTCHNYDHYIELIKKQPTEQREILGIGLIGDKKAIKKITGNLPLLK